MKSCCVSTLETMQELKELQAWLKLFLKASPYVVLIPEIGSGVLNEGIRETVKGQIMDTLIENLVDKATGASDLPDVKQAIASVDKIVLGKLQGLAQIHYLRHNGSSSEMRFWGGFVNLYDPAKQPVSDNGSWWNPFD